MLNWIVWNRTDYLYKNGFDIKQPTKVDMPKTPNNQPINNTEERREKEERKEKSVKKREILWTNEVRLEASRNICLIIIVYIYVCVCMCVFLHNFIQASMQR